MKSFFPSPKFQVYLGVFYPFLCGLRTPNALGVQWPGLKGGYGEEKALIQYYSIYLSMIWTPVASQTLLDFFSPTSDFSLTSKS